MSYTRDTDNNPFYQRDILNYFSQFTNLRDFVHLTMANKQLNKVFNLTIVRSRLKNFSIKQMVLSASNPNYYLFLDSNGEVYEGRFDKRNHKFDIEKLSGLPEIKSMIKTDSGIILLSVKGEVWVTGLNTHGELGTNTSGLLSHYWYPIKLAINKISQVSSISKISFFLDEDGKVWYCGMNNLPITDGNITEVPTPTLIDNLPIIKKITAASDQLFFIDQENTVWHSTKSQPLAKIPIKNIINVIYTGSKIYFINTEGKVFYYRYDLIIKSCIAEQVGGLKNIKSIISNNETTFYIDNKQKVFITGHIVRYKNNKTIGTSLYVDEPICISGSRAIQSVILNDLMYSAVLIDTSGNFDICESRKSSQNKLLKQMNESNMSNIDNGFLGDEDALFSTRSGNIIVHHCPENQEPITIYPYYNFAIQYHLDIIFRANLSMNQLLSYACSQDKENTPFYTACLNILRSESDVIRLYYFLQLQTSPQFDLSECAETLVVYPHAAYNKHFDFTELASSLAHLKIIIDLYQYFFSNLVNQQNEDYQFRLCNLIQLIQKFENNEINNTEEMNDFFDISKKSLTTHSLTLFSYSMTLPRFSQQYVSLREKLLSAGQDKEKFISMKSALLFMYKIIMDYSGKDTKLSKIQRVFKKASSLESRNKMKM